MPEENPYEQWTKLEVTTQQKTLYERQVGLFRLHILHRRSDDMVSLSFKIAQSDFSICDQPAPPHEIETLLGIWQRKGRLDNPGEIDALLSKTASSTSKHSTNGSTR